MNWNQVRDGDTLALQIFARHYTFRRYKDKRRDDPKNRMRNRIVGPGEYIMLIGNGEDRCRSGSSQSSHLPAIRPLPGPTGLPC